MFTFKLRYTYTLHIYLAATIISLISLAGVLAIWQDHVQGNKIAFVATACGLVLFMVWIINGGLDWWDRIADKLKSAQPLNGSPKPRKDRTVTWLIQSLVLSLVINVVLFWQLILPIPAVRKLASAHDPSGGLTILVIFICICLITIPYCLIRDFVSRELTKK